MSRSAEATNKFTGTYTVEAGDDTDDGTVLSVSSYNAGDVVELNYETSPAQLISGNETVAIGSLVVDATAPTATLDNSGHTYDTTGVITLAGSNFLTLGVDAGGDVKDILDFTKLTWDVDGEGTVTLSFTKDDIATAVATDGSTLTITLTTAAKNTLHALDGFGGATATGGTADVIDVADGFLQDAAGNASAEAGAQLSNASITLEATAPVIDAISVSPDDVPLFGIGDVITLTLELSEELNPSSALTLLMSNDAVIEFTVSDTDATHLVGTYTVAADEDVAAGNLDVQAVQSSTVLDLAGNALPSGDEMLGTGFDSSNGLTAVAIDATAPTASISATGHSYDVATGVLTLAGAQLNTLGITPFDNTVIPAESGDASAVVDMTKLTWDVDAGGSTTLQMPADAASSVVITDANTLTITLSASAQASLHALAGFGGTDSTGGVADAIDIATGFITDTAGNESTNLANPVGNAEVTLADTTAPTITGITSTTSDGSVLGAGDTITFTAAISEDLKADSEMTITLTNGATVSLARVSDDPDAMTGDYIIEETDNEANSGDPLGIAAYSIGTALDVSGNALASDTTIADFDNVTEHVIDTTPPTATISATGHTYSAIDVLADDGVTVATAAGTLVLAGTNLLTTGIAEAGDASGILDATKLEWDIDGSDAAPKVFAASDFESVVLTNDTTLTLTLTDAAMADLHARTGFGGTDATDGTADTIDVAIGLLADTAGNLSTGISSPVENAEVTLSDTAAPTITTVVSSVATDYSGGVGQVISFSATVSEDMSGTDGEITLTLSNNADVVLTHSNATTLTGDYTIGSEDLDTFADDGDASTLELSIVGYTPDVVDLSGNAIATDLTISDFDNVTDHVIDTTAPQLTIQTYVGSELVLAFNEAISGTSASALETAVVDLTEVTGTGWSAVSGDSTYKIAANTLSSGDTLNLTATADVAAATNASTALTLDGNDGDILVGSVVTGTGIVGDVTVVTVTDQNNIVLSSAQTLAEDAELTFTGLEVEDTAGNTLFIETLEIIQRHPGRRKK